jgi:tetratricopeptide (TPR) repeat protein
LLFRTKKKHPDCSIIWIPATSSENLCQAYLNVARQLAIPGWEDQTADVKALVKDHLSKDDVGQWLLVFDNADDIDMWIAKAGSGLQAGQASRPLIDYLPKSKKGAILFTTRDRKIAVKLAQMNVVDVPEMDEDAAAQLLKKCLVNSTLVNSRHDTSDLLSQLTYLPLAIVQAAAYINENGIALADYLSLLDEQEEEVIGLLSEEFEDEGRYRDVQNPIATTWLISFEQIRRRDPLAADYLSFMACVDPKDIPQSLRPPGPSRKKEMDAIGTLNAYCFISKRPADQALAVHRLVHLATRNWLRKEELLAEWMKKAVKRLEEVFPDNNPKNRSIWRAYLPHMRYVLEHDLVHGDRNKWTDLMWRYGMCLFEDGRWYEAEIRIAQVMETRRSVLGADHPYTLTSMVNLARIYSNQGRWKEAEEIFIEVIHVFERMADSENLELLSVSAELAATYRKMGEWKRAQVIEERVLLVRKRILGSEHHDTLRILSSLASTYWHQGRWQDAEKLLVPIRSKLWSVETCEDPEILKSMAELVWTYYKQGKLTEAEELGTEIMDVRETLLGKDHPDTLTSIAHMAAIYEQKWRLKAAEKLKLQVLETRRRLFGDDHPDTLISMVNLAMNYRHQGRENDAEPLERHVFELRKLNLGVDNPSTLISMNNLAWTLKRQGHHDAALQMIDECVRLSIQKLGLNNPSTQLRLWALNTWKKT